jgi:hypothetical protein
MGKQWFDYFNFRNRIVQMNPKSQVLRIQKKYYRKQLSDNYSKKSSRLEI